MYLPDGPARPDPRALDAFSDEVRAGDQRSSSRCRGSSGAPVREPAAWKPLHTQHWNGLLQPFGPRVAPGMPVWIETFELLYGRR